MKDEHDLSIRELQKEDFDLQKVKTWVADKKWPTFTEIKGESNTVKSLWSQWNSLNIVNDLLCRKWIGNRKEIMQILVPLSEKKRNSKTMS